jgi:hypothetical protein
MYLDAFENIVESVVGAYPGVRLTPSALRVIEAAAVEFHKLGCKNLMDSRYITHQQIHPILEKYT